MEQDTAETPVVFRRSRRKEPEGLAAEVTAVIPCESADYAGDKMTCYAHVGQHGACDMGWYYTTRPAKPEEYAELKKELESAPYGYRLKVYQKIHRWMHDARRKQAREFK